MRTYLEHIAFPAQPAPRFWRGPVRAALAAWSGVLSGAIIGIGFHLAWFEAIPIGIVVAAAVLGAPVPQSRRAEVELELSEGELRLRQGSRRRRVPVSDIRRVRVLIPTGTGRTPVGYGAVFGKGLRWTWDVPDPALGVVRIDRGRGGFDVDVATAQPDELARALRAALDR